MSVKTTDFLCKMKHNTPNALPTELRGQDGQCDISDMSLVPSNFLHVIYPNT